MWNEDRSETRMRVGTRYSSRARRQAGRSREMRAPWDWGEGDTRLCEEEKETKKMAGDMDGRQETPHAPGALTLLILVELPLELVEV